MDGKRRYGAVGGGIVLGAVFAAALSRPLPPPTAGFHPDIHSEYVKFLSGKDTVTAYIAYPERPQPAPAVTVFPETLAISDFFRRTPSSSPRTASSRSRRICCRAAAALPRPRTQ